MYADFHMGRVALRPMGIAAMSKEVASLDHGGYCVTNSYQSLLTPNTQYFHNEYPSEIFEGCNFGSQNKVKILGYKAHSMRDHFCDLKDFAQNL